MTSVFKFSLILIIYYSISLFPQTNPANRNLQTQDNILQFTKERATPLSGDYRVGLNAFNKITERNLYYGKAFRKVFKDAAVRTNKFPDKKISEKELQSKIIYYDKLTIESEKLAQQEVFEEYFILLENQTHHKGALDHSPTEEVFATLTEAINNLNSRGVSGHVRFLLSDTVYNELGSMIINITTTDTTDIFQTLTIKPDTNISSTTIKTNGSSPVFQIEESHIIINGSNTDLGTSRNLTIQNEGSSQSSGCISVFGRGSIQIKNLICKSSSPSVAYNLLFDNSTEILVENCELKKSAIGLQAQNNCTNLIVRNNDIGSQFAGEEIQNIGIGLLSSSFFLIESNRIVGLKKPYSSTAGTFGGVKGILIGNFAGGINSTNGIVNANIVQDIKHTGVDLYAYSALGIHLSGLDTNSNIVVSNNFISDILGDGDAGVFYNPHGIFIDQGGGYKIYHNTIVLTGTVNNAGQFGAAYTGACTIYPGTVKPDNLDIRNNIFSNSQSVSYPGSHSYAIYSGVSDTCFTDINFNDYHVSGINGILGFLVIIRSSLTDWRTATGKDSSSISIPINFISDTDLHLADSSIGDRQLIGTLLNIQTDIDNESRNPLVPYIGADEVTSFPLVHQLNIKVLIESFFNGTEMIQDTIQVFLANASSPFDFKDSSKIYLNTDGSGTCYFLNAVDSTNYLVIKHRNSVETWSQFPQHFTNSILTYDLTTDSAKAYGNNLVNKNSKWCIYSGDVNQDGFIDLSDLILIDNDSFNFASGYLNTDLTGDGIVDLNDMIICDNNAFNFVGTISPHN